MKNYKNFNLSQYLSDDNIDFLMSQEKKFNFVLDGHKLSENIIKEKLTEMIEVLYNDPIKIYRNMKVDDDYLNKLLNNQKVTVGKYWTYIKSECVCWHNNHLDKTLKNNIIFTGSVSWNDIDINDTFMYYFYLNNFEYEIKLKTNKIKLLEVEVNGENIQINNNFLYDIGDYEAIP